MSRPIRVLSLYEGFFAGGARVLHSDLIAGLHATGEQQHSVLSIASEARRESSVQRMQDDPRHRMLTGAGIAVTTLGRTAGAEPPGRSTYSDAELMRAGGILRDVDLVLSLKEQPLGLLLALRDAGLMPEIPVAVSLHRSDPMHSGPALGWLVDAAESGLVTATISCAWSTSDAYERAGVSARERHIIANGIDTDRFRPGTHEQTVATREELGIPDGAPVIVFAARFDAMKDPGLFLRAAAIHRAEHPETRIVLCGAGMTWSNDALRALALDSGLAPEADVHALGIRDDMPAVYQLADIVALTSAFGEASPLCLIEGAACGATPVTTNVGDAARQIDRFGFVTSHDAADIAATWGRVLSDRGRLRDAALAARPRLGRDRMIDEYASVAGSLLRLEEAAA